MKRRKLVFSIMRHVGILLIVTLGLMSIIGTGGGGGGVGGGGGGTTTQEVSAVLQPSSEFASPTETEVVSIDGVSLEAAKDQVLIYCDEDITLTELNNLLDEIEALGGSVVGSLMETRTLQVNIPSDMSEEDFMASIESMDGVAGTGLNLVLEPAVIKTNREGYDAYLDDSIYTYSYTPTIFAEAGSTTYPNIGGEGWWIETIKADQAWGISTGTDSDSAIIGIVDTGIPISQEIVNESRLHRYDAKGKSLTDDDTHYLTTHGTWVTGFAAGYNTDADICGVAWKNQVVMVDVCRELLGFLPLPLITDVQGGIVTAIEKGADIINVSIGDSSKCGDSSKKRLKSRQEYRKGLTGAVEAAKRNDCLIVFSAGNNCEKNDDQLLPDADDIRQDAWNTHALIVAATDENNSETWFTRMGDVVNIAAPGDDVGFGLGEGGGTSFAAPLVTGTAALVKSVSPTLSAPETRHVLLDNADNSVNAIASGPKLLLNAKKSVDTANLTKSVSLTSASGVELKKDEVETLDIEVTVPETTVSAVDVLFLVDVSGSYNDDIDSFQSQANEILSDLNSRGINVHFGVASFSDFPFEPYGAEGDKAFILNQAITDDVDAVIAGIDSLDNPLLYGNDNPESQLEALYQSACGEGLDLNGDGDFNDDGELSPGSVGWRTGALRIIIFATDASFHDSDTEPDYPGRGFSETITALQESRITVIGLQSGDDLAAQEDIQQIVDATGGQLYELSYDSNEIGDMIASGLDVALQDLDLTIKVVGGAEWVTEITPEFFSAVGPGETRTFTVHLLGQKDQTIFTDLSYDVYLWVWGDGSAIIQRVNIPIKVPST